MKKANIVFGIIGLLLSAYVWISSADFPYDKIMILGPEFFPRVMAVAMAIASAALLVYTYMVGTVGDGRSISLKNPGIRRAFIIDSLLFMMFMMYMLQFRSYGKMFLSSVLTIAIVIFAFQIMLQIQLPAGILDGMLPW